MLTVASTWWGSRSREGERGCSFQGQVWAEHFTSACTPLRGGLIIPISETKDLKLRT